MSNLDECDPTQKERSHNYSNKQASNEHYANNIKRAGEMLGDNPHSSREAYARNSSASDDPYYDHHDEAKSYGAPHGVSRGSNPDQDSQPRKSMHPAGISNSAAVPSAAAVYSQVVASQGARPPPLPSHFGSYISSRLPSSIHSPSPPSVHGSHRTSAVPSSAYRHLLSLPGQFPPTVAHPGLDTMWQPKYNPSPWPVHQYEEMRLERERAISQEREIRMERSRREDQERMERQKEERDKARYEKERQQREWQDQERLEREERERAQREAVQQHFEESLRLALQKQQHQQQQQQKGVSWSPVPNLPLNKAQSKGRSSPTVNMQPSQSHRSAENERDRMREKDKHRAPMMDPHLRPDHERWLAIVQQQRNEQVANHPQMQNLSVIESHRNQQKQESCVPISAHGPSASHALNKSSTVSGTLLGSSNSMSSAPSQMKTESNFSLYGYQPFQHTYITHAQLKAREDPKGPSSAQSHRIASGGQGKMSLIMKPEREIICERAPPASPPPCHSSSPANSSSKQQAKIHSMQERSSILYQPLGSGGAFKPYEYSTTSCSPAPPAHQNTSPTLIGRSGNHQYQAALQDQPQNLVKCEKISQEQMSTNQRYDARDSRQPPCSLPPCFSPPYSSSKSVSNAGNTTYSYSLIQQGLIPNPMYIAATHSGTSTTLSSSAVSFVPSHAPPKSHMQASSSPGSQQYAHISSGSNAPSSSVCHLNSSPYLPVSRMGHSYSPVPHPNSQNLCSNSNKPAPMQESRVSNRAHMNIQGSSHRSPSPSPAHLYASQPSISPSSPLRTMDSTSPRMNSGPGYPPSQQNSMQSLLSTVPFDHCVSHSESMSSKNQSGVNLVKRKLVKDMSVKKRLKTVDESLLPPQLQPQVHPANNAIGPLVSNSPSDAPILEGSHQWISHSGSGPSSPTNLSNRHATTPSPLPMPDLGVSHSQTKSVSEASYSPHIVENQSFDYAGKYKAFSSSSNVSAEESMECFNSASNSSVPTGAPDNSTQKSNAESSEESNNVVSTSSSAVTSSSTGSGTNHPKLKKAWLQRHSENEDKKTPTDVKSESKAEFFVKAEPSDTMDDVGCRTVPLSVPENLKTGDLDDDMKTKGSEDGSVDDNESKMAESEGQLEDDASSSSSDEDSSAKSNKKKGKIKKNLPTSNLGNKRQKTSFGVENSPEDQLSIKKDKDQGKKKGLEKETNSSSKRRGRKGKGKSIPAEDPPKKKNEKSATLAKPPEKPSIAHLRKSGEAFLQDGPCCEVAPRLPKCRECRMTPHQRSKKMPNIFCRFYAYRKLRYGKNGTILSAGFSEPCDATDDDLKLWLPPIESPPSDIEVETSKFLLTHVGDQFCDLVEMEREAQKMHVSEGDGTITWKRVVQGVREMCDVCETTLFNIHWVCHKCGFVVCIDCYKSRKNGVVREESASKDRDEFQWLFCTNRQAHEQEKLMLTQIIAGTALWDVGKTLHDIRRKWNIPTYCNCGDKELDQEGKHSSNGICKLMSAVTKCFSSDKEDSQINGSTDSNRSKKSVKSSVNGVKQEDELGGYSSESGGSPLSWLADVALNSSSKLPDEQKEKSKDEEEKFSDGQASNTDELAESDDDKNENFSTLRELLIRPTGKMGGKSSGSSLSSQKTLTSTLDEVISCVIEQKVRKSDKKCKEKQLLHFSRRCQMSRSGRELPPIRTCILAESSLLYPEIPHVWLGSGKILLLKDPYHSGNMQMFQEQWKRGQPVIISDVGKNLDSSLWNPESFLKEFGELKNDFIDCKCETVLQNQPMKKFWEGFENVSKRLKNDDGDCLILKLKDWPPSEDFSDVLPTRYEDLIKVLPLQQYTNREGVLNMASRLPDCFVRPDLGPRLYNAYGFTSNGKGSTNLHLDVSDGINVLAYVATTCDTDEESLITGALEESGCDSMMMKRSKEKGSKPGAIWHIYNSRDADKIRDFLNKVSEEQGVKLNLHHDPIHNQEWYLTEKLRNRLLKEYGVEAYSIAQCHGDAIFIPAGSPHQVLNVNSCIKVSEEFVSPESIGHSFFLTQEIRNLCDGPMNHEDKLQIKNIIYHAVKDALALLQSHDPEDLNA